MENKKTLDFHGKECYYDNNVINVGERSEPKGSLFFMLYMKNAPRDAHSHKNIKEAFDV